MNQGVRVLTSPELQTLTTSCGRLLMADMVTTSAIWATNRLMSEGSKTRSASMVKNTKHQDSKNYASAVRWIMNVMLAIREKKEAPVA